MIQNISGNKEQTSTTGVLTRILQRGITEDCSSDSEGGEVKTRNRPPTLEEVLGDPDFLAEAKLDNESLRAFFTRDKVLEMVDLVIKEPEFIDTPTRCYNLPFIACEAFINETMGMIAEHVLPDDDDYSVLTKMFTFFEAPDPYLKKDVPELNPTLGGYLNKIFSFWLMKQPRKFLNFISQGQRTTKIVQNLFSHLYLSHCVVDLLVRFCCVPNLQEGIDIEHYMCLR